MRSVCQSINLLCTAFGSLAAAGLNSIMAGWIPDNLNTGHLEYVFFVVSSSLRAVSRAPAVTSRYVCFLSRQPHLLRQR